MLFALCALLAGPAAAQRPGAVPQSYPVSAFVIEYPLPHPELPPIEELLGRVDSKFGLVTLAARRARNINAYFNQLGEGLGHMIPPQVSSVARKPLSIGFEEIAADKPKAAGAAGAAN